MDDDRFAAFETDLAARTAGAQGNGHIAKRLSHDSAGRMPVVPADRTHVFATFRVDINAERLVCWSGGVQQSRRQRQRPTSKGRVDSHSAPVSNLMSSTITCVDSRLVSLSIFVTMPVVNVFMMFRSRKQESVQILLKIREAIAILVLRTIASIARIEIVFAFPFIWHAIMVGIGGGGCAFQFRPSAYVFLRINNPGDL